jgi:hypothetical protein
MSFNFPNCEREPRKRFTSKNIDHNRVRVDTLRLRFGESSDNGRERLRLGLEQTGSYQTQRRRTPS